MNDLIVKESKAPPVLTFADSATQEEYEHLKVLSDRILADLDDAAHYMGIGTPSYACTHTEAFTALINRMFELEVQLRDENKS